MKRWAVLLCLLPTPPMPASAAEIARFATGAYCRDATGHVRQPNVRPPVGSEADRDARGRIQTHSPDGTDCFFYPAEVALTETPPPCSSAASAVGDKKVAGTLGGRSCAEQAQ